MRKVVAAASLLACMLIASWSAASSPDVVSTALPRIATTYVTTVTAVDPDEPVERVALTSRDRVARPADDAQWNAVPIVADEASTLLDQLVTAERAVRDPAVTGTKLA